MLTVANLFRIELHSLVKVVFLIYFSPCLLQASRQVFQSAHSSEKEELFILIAQFTSVFPTLVSYNNARFMSFMHGQSSMEESNN